ncbi:hypothetical protein [Nitrospira moscoviensis]|nr:hypothetical protein [Nitrospira moscoviensis]
MKCLLYGALSAVALWAGLGCGIGAAAGPVREAALPEPPREWVDTAMPSSAGRTIHVPAGGDLQDALDEARPGDVITLAAGAVYRGPFTLSNKKSGTGWITIQTDALDKLPPPGTRVSPSQASLMPTLISRKSHGVVTADKGAHHYRFIGLEVRPEEGAYIYSLLWFGQNKERSLEELPHHIVVDRCYLHGDPKKGSRRGVALNGRHLAVIDSHLSDFKEVGADSQAIMGWAGSGPFKIVNNRLEAAAEPINFGGGDPSIRDLVPSDIEIRHNHMTKPLSWKHGEPGYDGSSWAVKNLFELKNARRVVIDGNVLEHNWEHAQNGFAVLFTVRNQDGTAPWSAIEDVRFTNNIVRHSGSGLNLIGHDDNHPPDRTVQTKRILVKNNLWEDIGGTRWGGRGILFQVLWGTSDVVIEDNTGMQTGSVIHSEGPPHTAFVFRRNVMPHNEWGIFGRDAGTGIRALEAYFPGAVVTGNIFAGGDSLLYPSGNRFVDSAGDLLSTNAKAGNYRPAASKQDGGVGEGEQAGVDISALCQALGPLRSLAGMCQTPVAEAQSRPSTER